VSLLKKSGCQRLSTGAESGSDKVLKMISKDITNEEIIRGIAAFSNTGIKLDVTFMCGFPGESMSDTRQTFKTIDSIRRINKNAFVTAVYVFTPYPGTTLYKEAIEKHGFKAPGSLAEWAGYKINLYPQSPWLNRRQKNFYANLSIMTRFPFCGSDKDYAIPFHIKQKKLYRILSFLAVLRWKMKFFFFPAEWRLVRVYLEKTRGYV
jgi:radical SAM superfamily enzyme YgiQ (UPF0313 family)